MLQRPPNESPGPSLPRDAALELRKVLYENLTSIHHDVLCCAERLTGDLDVDRVLDADLEAARLVVAPLSSEEIQTLLVRSVIGVESAVREVRDRVVLARAALDRLTA